MKAKIIYLIITLISLPNLIFAIDTTQVRYMPFNIGNVYVYHWTQGSVLSGNVRVKFTKDTMAIGKRYFVNEYQVDNYYGHNPYYYRYMRMDSLKANLMGFYMGNECLIDSLSARRSDSETSCFMGRVACVDTGIFTILNYQTNKKNFSRNDLSGLSDYYAKNIGMYSAGRGEMGPFFNLIGCVINGVVYGDTNFLVGVRKISSEVPKSFSLFQNYPNPFNPSTNIKYQIPPVPSGKTGFVKLTMYNVLGKEVVTLVNEKQSAGTYEVDWNASNYPSGVYFYKMIAGDYSETRKMVLIK